MRIQSSKRQRAIRRDLAWIRSQVRSRYDEGRSERDAIVTERDGAYGHWSCGRKRRYEFEDDARDAAIRYTGMYSKETHAYRCGLCGGWHLTTRP